MGLRPFLAEFWRFNPRVALITLGLNLVGALLDPAAATVLRRSPARYPPRRPG